VFIVQPFTWRHLEQYMESEVRSDARFVGSHDARCILLVVREEELVEIIPDGRLRWVPEVVTGSHSRWQSCWEGKSHNIVAGSVRRRCQSLSKPENEMFSLNICPILRSYPSSRMYLPEILYVNVSSFPGSKINSNPSIKCILVVDNTCSIYM